MKRFFIFLLCGVLLLSVVACGNGKSNENKTPESTTAKPEEQTDAAVYPYYEGKDFGGAEITILNYESYCGTNLAFAPDEYVTGDLLNNAMYARTAAVEEKLNVSIREDRKGYADMGGWGGQANYGQLVATSVGSGQFTWDIANVFLNWKASLITDGCLVDLRTLEELHLEEDYWDQNIMNELTLNGKTFAGSSKLTLMPLDLTWVLFFNENMMKNLGLDSPYELVDNKEWTLAKMLEYVKAGSSLNGGDTPDFENDPSTICGIATHSDSVSAFVIAADNQLLKREDGEIVANVSNQHLFDTIEKVQEIFSKSMGYSNLGVSLPNSNEPYGCIPMFRSGRALFLTSELKDSKTLRDEMDDTYGILPPPLYDGEQKEYRSVLGSPAMLTIPVLQNDLSRTALVLDALSYESTNVMDTYYTRIITHRNLKNEESERMLHIIHDCLTIEFGEFFGFTNQYLASLREGIRAENVNPASLAKKETDNIEMRVYKFMLAFPSEDEE